MRVCPGNESLATPEVMAKVAKLAEKMKELQKLRDEIVEMCENDYDLDHLSVSDGWTFNTNADVMAEHEQWLASNHNC